HAPERLLVKAPPRYCHAVTGERHEHVSTQGGRRGGQRATRLTPRDLGTGTDPDPGNGERVLPAVDSGQREIARVVEREQGSRQSSSARSSALNVKGVGMGQCHCP